MFSYEFWFLVSHVDHSTRNIRNEKKKIPLAEGWWLKGLRDPTSESCL
jgi:hypothetical protein